MKLGVLLALLATPLAAQAVQDRLEGRVPVEAIPTVDSLARVAAQEGLPSERIVTALPRPPRAAAVHAVADLVAHHFDPDSGAGLIIEAIHQGLHGERLLDVSTAALAELQRGHTHAEALALVRQELPNVPPAPKPSRATVVRARRPPGQQPP